MPASPSRRQSLPRWHVARPEADMPAPSRGAKIVPFPGQASRRSSVVTYPAPLVIPDRRADGLIPACVTDARLALAGAMLALAAALLLL